MNLFGRRRATVDRRHVYRATSHLRARTPHICPVSVGDLVDDLAFAWAEAQANPAERRNLKKMRWNYSLVTALLEVGLVKAAD